MMKHFNEWEIAVNKLTLTLCNNLDAGKSWQIIMCWWRAHLLYMAAASTALHQSAWAEFYMFYRNNNIQITWTCLFHFHLLIQMGETCLMKYHLASPDSDVSSLNQTMCFTLQARVNLTHFHDALQPNNL